MKHILFFFLLFSSAGFGQTSGLQISIYNYYRYEDCSRIILIHDTDTLINETTDEDFDQLYDSLVSGPGYELRVLSCEGSDFFRYSKIFSLAADSITTLSLDPSRFTMETTPIDKKSGIGIARHKQETQLTLGYFNNRWVEKNPGVTSSLYAGFTQSGWLAFSRHTGLLVGGGLGLSHASISRDTTYMKQPELSKRYEYYNYLDGHFDVRFRFSTGNQQLDEFRPGKLLLDVGASYYLPLMFRHNAWYGGGKKMSNLGLHQFSDVRLYANLGFYTGMLFVEYRPFDFILGSYPEFPRYLVGFRIAFDS